MAEGFRPSVDPDDLEPVADATPLSRSVATRQQRRHRWLTVPSGWVLVVCLFLPSLQFCDSGDGVPMAVFPFLWPPYLAGLFVALAATARPESIGPSGFGVFMLIRVSAVGLAGSLVLEMLDAQVGAKALVAIALSIVAFVATWRPPSERAVAANSAMAATGSFAFTLALALDRHAVWGAYVAVIAAGVLLAGTLAWCLETLVRPA